MKKLLLPLAAAALSVAGPACAQNLVTNGSFETGNFASWTLGQAGGGTAPVVVQYGQASNYPTGPFGEAIPVDNAAGLSPDGAGQYTAYFSSDTANAHTLTQTINMVAGTTYNLGFDFYAPFNGYNNPFDASLSLVIDGATVATATAGSVAGTPPGVWQTFNTSFVAAATGAASLVFEFRGLGTPAADFAIDRVYAVAAVPEPAAWAMMIFGFGAVGGALRSRRKRNLALAAA
jgi:hypothetical protein